MKRSIRSLKAALVLLLAVGMITAAGICTAEEPFTDESFQGNISTETLDAIIEKYELYDGWYWTTEADVPQTFHGREDKPGWTDSALTFGRGAYLRGWYGYRWGKETVNPRKPNDAGYGECYGFAQFIGYLLTGERNPQRNWKAYPSIRRSEGLQPGDIIRADYEKNGKKYYHSAVVYSVDGDDVLFMQASGGNYNQLRIRQGYTDGYVKNVTNIKALAALDGTTIYRYIPKDD